MVKTSRSPGVIEPVRYWPDSRCPRVAARLLRARQLGERHRVAARLVVELVEDPQRVGPRLGDVGGEDVRARAARRGVDDRAAGGDELDRRVEAVGDGLPDGGEDRVAGVGGEGEVGRLADGERAGQRLAAGDGGQQAAGLPAARRRRRRGGDQRRRPRGGRGGRGYGATWELPVWRTSRPRPAAIPRDRYNAATPPSWSGAAAGVNRLPSPYVGARRLTRSRRRRRVRRRWRWRLGQASHDNLRRCRAGTLPIQQTTAGRFRRATGGRCTLLVCGAPSV